MPRFQKLGKSRNINKIQQYNERKEKNLCTQCGLNNDNLPMVRCKSCYQKLKDARKAVAANGGYK